MSEPKTDRRYGMVFEIIRDVAIRRPTFTVLDLTFGMTKQQAIGNCNVMVYRGELTKVKPAGIGMKATPAIYAKTTHEK